MQPNSDIRVVLSAALFENTGIAFSSRTIQDTGALLEVAFWFEQLGFREGPVFSIKAEGLHRHSVQIKFGSSAEPIIRQIQSATTEQQQIAHQLLELLQKRGFKLDSQLDDIEQLKAGFIACSVTLSKVENHLSIESLRNTVATIVSILGLAMAELIGYAEHPMDAFNDEFEFEGAISLKVIRQRERSRKNRQLCLGYHGNSCLACGVNPKEKYGTEAEIIEVHHIQPLSTLDERRIFDPVIDLIPLCPNCHRAIHTRRPMPLTIEELRERLAKHA